MTIGSCSPYFLSWRRAAIIAVSLILTPFEWNCVIGPPLGAFLCTASQPILSSPCFVFVFHIRIASLCDVHIKQNQPEGSAIALNTRFMVFKQNYLSQYLFPWPLRLYSKRGACDCKKEMRFITRKFSGSWCQLTEAHFKLKHTDLCPRLAQDNTRRCWTASG